MLLKMRMIPRQAVRLWLLIYIIHKISNNIYIFIYIYNISVTVLWPYAFFSYVLLLPLVDPRVRLRLAWLIRPFRAYIQGSAMNTSIVYLRGCQLSLGREQPSSRRIIFKGDNFVRFMGDTLPCSIRHLKVVLCKSLAGLVELHMLATRIETKPKNSCFPVLKSLDWLKIQERIRLKFCHQDTTLYSAPGQLTFTNFSLSSVSINPLYPIILLSHSFSTPGYLSSQVLQPRHSHHCIAL